MWQEIVNLFQYMTLPIAICLIVGLVCVILEIFQPGFGVFGIVGIILLLVGIFWRIALGNGQPVLQFLLLVFFILTVLGIAFVVMIKSAKKGWLSRSSIMATEQVVEGISDGTENYVALVGKKGTAISDLKPIGKAEIDGRVFDVTADSFFVERGASVRVHAVEGVRIVVKKE